MNQRQSTIVRRVLVGGAALWALALAAAPGGVVRAQEGRKIWDGVYTEAQAARGKPAYETSCGRCHNNELAGSERAPALKGDGFWAHWENDSLDRLFTKIRDTMPSGGIESVTDAGKLDILAYVLSRNEAAPGKRNSPSTAASSRRSASCAAAVRPAACRTSPSCRWSGASRVAPTTAGR